MHEIGRINGGKGFQPGGNVFQIGKKKFYDWKNEISIRSGIRIIAKFRRIPTRFSNQVKQKYTTH
jgi:hypothetical protein